MGTIFLVREDGMGAAQWPIGQFTLARASGFCLDFVAYTHVQS